MNQTNETSLLLKTCNVFQQTFFVPAQFSSQKYVVNHISACVAGSLVCLSNILLNGIALLIFYKTPKLREKASHYFIMLQSLADLVVGVLPGPLSVYIAYSQITGSTDCVLVFINRLVSTSLVMYSMLISLAMNFERYLGVVHPIYHRTKVTKKYPRTFAVCAFAFCLLLLVLSLFLKLVASIIRSILVIVWALATVYIYIRIFFAATALRVKTSDDNSLDSGENPRPSANISQPSRDASERSKKRSLLKEIKLAKMCFLVVLCSFVCYLPYAIVTRVLSEDTQIYYSIRVWLIILAMLNSSLNSLLFFWMNKILRVKAKEIVNSIFCSQPVNG